MGTKLRIIGLSGTNGAGKDTVGDLLAQRYNYLFVSVTELLREECRRRGLPVERQHLRAISAEWRREYGLGVLVDRAMEQFRSTGDKYAGIVMSSLRNPHEAKRIHELDGTVVWVDADPEIRYRRVISANRGRDGEDDKTYEEFLAEEASEMQRSGDEATLDMAAVKELSDITLLNNAGTLDALELELQQTLGI